MSNNWNASQNIHIGTWPRAGKLLSRSIEQGHHQWATGPQNDTILPPSMHAGAVAEWSLHIAKCIIIFCTNSIHVLNLLGYFLFWSCLSYFILKINGINCWYWDQANLVGHQHRQNTVGRPHTGDPIDLNIHLGSDRIICNLVIQICNLYFGQR